MDSTGLQVYGEGEWKVRQHGAGQRRTWRKIHFAVDVKVKDVMAVEITGVSQKMPWIASNNCAEIAWLAGNGQRK